VATVPAARLWGARPVAALVPAPAGHP